MTEEDKQTFRVTLANYKEEEIRAVRMILNSAGDLLLVNDPFSVAKPGLICAVYPSGQYIRAVRVGSQQ